MEDNSEEKERERAVRREQRERELRRSVGEQIKRYVHRVRDIRHTARFVRSARRSQNALIDRSLRTLDTYTPLLKSDSQAERARAQHTLSSTTGLLFRTAYSNPPRVLLRSLFLGLFSAFDAFTGNLVRALYLNRDDLFWSLGGRTVNFSDILSASDIGSLKETVLAEEIEALRRKSYTDQFQDLETRFGLKTLRDFSAWKRFIECSQRRNLITHCDGVVSPQYIRECKKAGYSESELPKIGEEVQISHSYVLESCELLIEIGAKLGIVLWRKAIPSEIGAADDVLNRLIYEALEIGRWPRAIMFGEFATSLPSYSDEKRRRMFLINHIQAVKWVGNEQAAMALLDKEDWTATSRDFQLAVAVLRDNFEEAANIMRQIGSGDEVPEGAYASWPLFSKFRQSQEFLTAYEAIYGYPFYKQLEAAASNAAAEVAKRSPEDDHNEFPGDVELSGGTDAVDSAANESRQNPSAPAGAAD